MKFKEAEDLIAAKGDEGISWAVARLAALTPGIVYTPGAMKERIRERLAPNDINEDDLNLLMISVGAIANGAVMNIEHDPSTSGATIRMGDVTYEGGNIGDWEVDYDIFPFIIEPETDTEEAAEVLSKLHHEDLRATLGRLIDKTWMTFVADEKTYVSATGKNVNGIAAIALRKVLEPGSGLDLNAVLIRPGESGGSTVNMKITRISAPDPEHDVARP